MDPSTPSLLVTADLGGTLYQFFNVRAVQILGAETDSEVALITTVCDWSMAHLFWEEESSLLDIIGLVLALTPCIWTLLFGGFDLERSESSSCAS